MRVIISLNDASQNNSDISFIELEGTSVEIIEVLQSNCLPIPKMKEAVDTGSDVSSHMAVDPQHINPYVNFKFEDVEVGDNLVFIDDREIYVVDTIDCNDRSYCGYDGYWKWYDDLYCGEYGKVILEKKKK